MVAIPTQERDPLVALINEYLEAEENAQPQRTYLGASSIGEECSRKLWYKLNGEKEIFDAKTIRRFQDGHDTEAKIIRWLQAVGGIEIYARNPTETSGPDAGGHDGSQIGFGLFDGRFKGHYDAIGRGFPQAPKTWHIVEIKCVEEKSFKELVKLKELNEKAAIQQWKPEYYAQVQVYMHMEKLTRSIHIVATPGGRDLISVRTEYDKNFAEAMLAKAKRIIDAKEPPERIGGKDFWKCKMCFISDKCHAAS